MYEKLLSLLKPHVANKDRCFTLVERLLDLFESEMEKVKARIEEDSLNESYEGGYSDGVGDGLEEGYNEGYNNGLNEGYDHGYDQGHEIGYSKGYDEGSWSRGKARKNI